MRVGSIRLNVRSIQDQKCVMCNICDDTTEHMMHCEYDQSESIQAMLGHTLPVVNGLQWLFHPDRLDTIRSNTSRWIKARWAQRSHKLQEEMANG